MRIALLALVFLNCTVHAGNTNDPSYSTQVNVVGWSPLQTFYMEEHLLYPKEEKQVWLVSSKLPTNQKLLYTYSRSVQVLVSDDEHWLAINDFSGSSESEVLLFQKQNGLNYQQVEDITDQAWRFLAGQSGHKEALDWDHTYVEVLRWTDSHTILLCLYGHLDEHHHVEDWLCFYDVNNKTFSTDLDKHNKQHTMLEAKP